MTSLDLTVALHDDFSLGDSIHKHLPLIQYGETGQEVWGKDADGCWPHPGSQAPLPSFSSDVDLDFLLDEALQGVAELVDSEPPRAESE